MIIIELRAYSSLSAFTAARISQARWETSRNKRWNPILEQRAFLFSHPLQVAQPISPHPEPGERPHRVDGMFPESSPVQPNRTN